MNAKNLALNLLIKAKDLASDTLNKFQTTVKDTGDQTDDLGDAMDEAAQHTDALESSLQKTESQVNNTHEALNSAKQSAGQFADELSDADKAAGRFYDKQGKLREASGQFVAGAKRAKGASQDLGNEFDKTGRKANGLSGNITALARKAKGALAGMAAAIGLGQLFSGAIQSSISFEKQLDRVQAVTNATADEMQQLQSAAEHAGSTTKFTATQAAEGLEILARSGYSAQQSMALLPTLLNVAIAEGMELDGAAQILSDTLSIMGKNAEYGAQAADILAKGSSLSATTIEQLGHAISYSGAEAKSYGMDLVELTAVLDVLAKHGLRSERAGTGLRSILVQLADPTSKASAALADLGIETNDLGTMLDGLQAAGEKGKAAILEFGVEAGPALRALVASGSDGIREFAQELDSATGAAQRMADIAADNLDGSIKGLGSAWDALRRKLTDPLLQPLAELADELAEKFRELGPAFDAFGQIVLAIMPRIQGTFKVAYNTFTLAAKSIGIFTSQIAVWATETELALAQVLNSVGLVSDETVKALEIQAGGVRAVLQAMKDEAAQDIEDIKLGTALIWDGWAEGAEAATQQQTSLTTATETTNQVTAQATELTRAQTEALKAQEAAWKILGMEAAEALGGITQEGSEVIGAFSTITQGADVTSKHITGAFTGAIAKAKTKEEATALIAILEEMATQGKISSSELQDALAGVSDELRQLSGEAENAWSTLGLEMEAVTGKITDQGRAALSAFQDITSEGKLTADQLQVVFNAALGKSRTRAEVEALLKALKQARSEGKVTGSAFSKAFEKGKAALKAFDKQVTETEQALTNAGTSGARAMDEIGSAARSASQEVGGLADETNRLNETSGKGSESSRTSRSNFGAQQHFDLIKRGETDAAEHFQVLADAYSKTLEGLVLGPKGAEAVEIELNKLKQQALQLPSSRSPVQPSTVNTGSTTQRTLRVELTAPGHGTVSGDFDEGSADQLVRMLGEIGSVTG